MTSDKDDLEQVLRENLRLRRELGAEARKASGGMAYRLGWVLYWAGCIIGVLSAVLGVLATFLNREDAVGWDLFLLPFAVLIWLIGRAMRHVLSGD